MPIFVALILLLLVAARARGPAVGEKTYSLRAYDLAIEPDFKARTIRLDVAVDVDNPSLQDSFEFGLSDRYSYVTVSSDSSPTTFERGEGEIVVRLAKATPFVRLRFRLAGSPGRSVDEHRSVIEDSSLFLLWSDRFYPIDFDRWAPVRTAIVLPAGFQAVAPGRLMSSDAGSGNIRFVFQTARPTLAFSVFADSRWRKSEREVNGVRMRTLLYPASGQFRDRIFASSGDVLKFYSDVFCPYPFDEFSFVEIDSIYARRAFPGFVGYSPPYLEKEFSSTGYDAHETALLWWDYTTRGSGPGSFQWTEGFGDYAEIMYANEKGKPFPPIFRTFREKYLDTPAALDLHYSELKGNTPQELIHGKYPWLMHVLRYVTGEQAFRKGLHLLLERFQHRTFTMEEFISTLEKGTGQSLRWWREEWIERKGVPDIVMSSAVTQADSGYEIRCALTQQGNIYHIPLEIAIDSESGTRMETVHLARRSETFAFRSPTPPRGIRLDPDGWILMRQHRSSVAK